MRNFRTSMLIPVVDVAIDCFNEHLGWRPTKQAMHLNLRGYINRFTALARAGWGTPPLRQKKGGRKKRKNVARQAVTAKLKPLDFVLGRMKEVFALQVIFRYGAEKEQRFLKQ